MPIRFPFRDLAYQHISTSYQDVVQKYYPIGGDGLYILDGIGNVISYISSASVGSELLTSNQTASFAFRSISSSYSTTASYGLNNINSQTASLAFHSYIADLAYIADVAEIAESASIAITSSYAMFAESASWTPGSGTAGSASWAAYAVASDTSQTASYVAGYNVDGEVLQSLYSEQSNTSSFSFYAESYTSHIEISTSFAASSISSSYSETASYVLNNESGIQSIFSTQSLFATSSLTASYISSSAIFDDFVYKLTASFSNIAISSSNSITSSYVIGIPIIQHGVINGNYFYNNPKIVKIIFINTFPDNNYSVVVSGESPRLWTIQNKDSGSFEINSNNNVPFVDNVFWQSIYGGTNYISL